MCIVDFFRKEGEKTNLQTVERTCHFQKLSLLHFQTDQHNDILEMQFKCPSLYFIANKIFGVLQK